MMDFWRDCRLGDVLTLQRGFDLPERERRPGLVPIVSSSGVTGYHDTAKAEGPGVATGRCGTLGEVFYIEMAFWPLNTSLFVKDFKGNDKRYVRYLLQTLPLERQNAAGAVPGLNRNHLHELPVRVPEVRIQASIASVLAPYDSIIENATRRIAILQEMSRALYHEWFVELRFPGHELTSRVASAIGEVPSGWEVGRLKDILVLQRGFDLPKAERVQGQVPIHAATGGNGYHNEAKVKAPGVVTGRSGSIGKVTYVQEDFWPLNTTLWVKEFPKSEPLCAFFVLSGLDLAQFNSGSAIPTLNRNDIHGLPVLIPPMLLQRQFQVIVSSMLAQAKILALYIDSLRVNRDFLLPRLISGELDVSNLPDPGAV